MTERKLDLTKLPGWTTNSLPSRVIEGEVVRYDNYDDVNYLSTEGAKVSFCFDKGEDTWVMVDLDSTKKGEGKRIVKEMFYYLGKGQRVRACIIEEETVLRLKKLGYADKVWDGNERYEITNKEELRQLKIVRVIEGGGFITDKIEVSRGDSRTDPDMVEMNVIYYGHT